MGMVGEVMGAPFDLMLIDRKAVYNEGGMVDKDSEVNRERAAGVYFFWLALNILGFGLALGGVHWAFALSGLSAVDSGGVDNWLKFGLLWPPISGLSIYLPQWLYFRARAGVSPGFLIRSLIVWLAAGVAIVIAVFVVSRIQALAFALVWIFWWLLVGGLISLLGFVMRYAAGIQFTAEHERIKVPEKWGRAHFFGGLAAGAILVAYSFAAIQTELNWAISGVIAGAGYGLVTVREVMRVGKSR